MDNLRSSIIIAILTFFIAVTVSSVSQTQVPHVSLPMAVIILLLIIIIGVLADMVGVAATVAREEPFNARAAKKVFGAKWALYLTKNGDKVASLMCDIIGDICGTISGAVGAVMAIRIIGIYGFSNFFTNLFIIGTASALTVGGKAFFKYYAIKNANEIIFLSGKFLAIILLSKEYLRDLFLKRRK
ncbi:MAG: hypothetical protein ACOC17_00680 [Halanaerobium sp.]